MMSVLNTCRIFMGPASGGKGENEEIQAKGERRVKA